MAKTPRLHEGLCWVQQSYSLYEILASVNLRWISSLISKGFFQWSDFYAFMLVCLHISEKEAELGRMVKAYLCSKKKKKKVKHTKAKMMALEWSSKIVFLASKNNSPSICDTVNVISCDRLKTHWEMLFLKGVFLLCSSSIFIYATSPSNVLGFVYVCYLPLSSISFMQLDWDTPGKIKYLKIT